VVSDSERSGTDSSESTLMFRIGKTLDRR